MKPFYLDKTDSAALKGLFILLIVLGHNVILCPNDGSSRLFSYLYQFHVQAFFILPFFYCRPSDVSGRHIFEIVKRTLVPYFWVFLFCSLVTYIVTGQSVSIGDYGLGFILGTQAALKPSCGFNFPWFLMSFASFSVILEYSKKYRTVGIITFVVAVAFLALGAFFPVNDWPVPFGFVLALKFFAFGVIASLFLESESKWIKYSGIAVFVICSVLFWTGAIRTEYLSYFFPWSFFIAAVAVLPVIRCGFFEFLGKNSLVIYLSHVFITNVLTRLFPHNLAMGLVSFALTVAMSLCLSVCVNRSNVICQVFLGRKARVDRTK